MAKDFSGYIPLIVLGLVLLMSAVPGLFARSSRRQGSGSWQPSTEGDYVTVTRDGKEVYEHREVAEEVLGRALEANEVVHHINGMRFDNRPENLCVMSREAHEAYHVWYRLIQERFKVRPTRATQLKKLEHKYEGILLARRHSRGYRHSRISRASGE